MVRVKRKPEFIPNTDKAYIITANVPIVNWKSIHGKSWDETMVEARGRKSKTRLKVSQE